MTLWRGLPETALSKQEGPGVEPWSMTDELLAQLIEEVSVLAADRRRKDPRQIKRPWERHAPKEGLSGDRESGMTARGLGGMLALGQVMGAVAAGE